MSSELVPWRFDQAERVERLASSLIMKCLEHGASNEETLVGLIGAVVATCPEEDQPARIEWIRTILDTIERGLLQRGGPTWTH